MDSLGRRTQHLGLHILERKGNRWVMSPDSFAFNAPQFSSCHGVLDTLGYLIFASDRPGGQGCMDLWRCEPLESGGWGEPKNLGPEINSAGNEVFPFVNSVNQLYFSSDGQSKRYYGLDVYKHDFERKQTVLLGDPVNSFADDFALVVDGKGRGFLSSNRDDGMDRIYALELLDVFADFEVQFVACDALSAHGIEVRVVNKVAMQEDILKTDNEGKVAFRARIGEVVELSFGGDWTYQGIEPQYMSPVEGFSAYEVRWTTPSRQPSPSCVR